MNGVWWRHDLAAMAAPIMRGWQFLDKVQQLFVRTAPMVKNLGLLLWLAWAYLLAFFYLARYGMDMMQ